MTDVVQAPERQWAVIGEVLADNGTAVESEASLEVEPIDHENQELAELSYKDLKRVAKAFKNGEGVTVNEVLAYLDEDFSEVNIGIRFFEYATPVVLAVGGLATYGAVNYDRVTGKLGLPSLGSLSEVGPDGEDVGNFWHHFLQGLHVRFNGHGAASTEFKEHLPFLMAEGALASAFRPLSKFFGSRFTKAHLSRVQDEMREKVDSGEMRWKINPGDSVIITAHGYQMARAINKRKPGTIIQLGEHEHDRGIPYTYLSRNAGLASVKRALEHADFDRAGSLFLLPTNDRDSYLPGEFDISLPQITQQIRAADEHCGEAGVTQKKVIIVGGKYQSLKYSTIYASGAKTQGRETLKQTVDRFNSSRPEWAQIEIVDPDEIVTRKILEIANGREIALHGEIQSNEEYEARFQASVDRVSRAIMEDEKDDTPLPGTTNSTSIQVVYNLEDRETIDTAFKKAMVINDSLGAEEDIKSIMARIEHIYVVQDTEAHDELLSIRDDLGRQVVSPEEIIVISQLVDGEIDQVLSVK